jgi:hypothetical protein
MAVRKLKKSYISCIGYFKSCKNNKQLAFDSILERECFYYLEFDDEVISYEEQPFTMYYELNGSRTRYTPDILVTYRDASQKLYEVKYKDEIDSDEELQYKLSILKDEVLKQKQLAFEVFTDLMLDDVYMKNCTFLYKYAFLQKDNLLTLKVSNAINNQNAPVSVKTLLETIAVEPNEQLKLLPYIWHEVFKSRSLINMYTKITMSSMIHSGGYNE